jgi:hypothetical protein
LSDTAFTNGAFDAGGSQLPIFQPLSAITAALKTTVNDTAITITTNFVMSFAPCETTK